MKKVVILGSVEGLNPVSTPPGWLNRVAPPMSIVAVGSYLSAHGVPVELIDVEVDRGRGLPSFVLVGLPDAAVKESGQRVEAAIKNSGLVWPRARLTVTLAPASTSASATALPIPLPPPVTTACRLFMH